MHENAKQESNCSNFADALQCIIFSCTTFPHTVQKPGAVWHKKMWKVPPLYSIFITRTIQAILRKLVLFYKAICRKRTKRNHKNCSSPSSRFVMTKVHSCINWIIIRSDLHLANVASSVLPERTSKDSQNMLLWKFSW